MSDSGFGFIALIIASVALYHTWNSPDGTPTPPPQDTRPLVQRYQIISHQYAGQTLLIDTQEGKIWRRIKHTYLNDDPEIWTQDEVADYDGKIGLPMHKYVEWYGNKSKKNKK